MILNYTTSKPLDTPQDQSLDSSSFSKTLEDTISPENNLSAKERSRYPRDHIYIQIDEAQENYRQLLEALQFIEHHNKAPTESKLRAALTDAGRLVELLAKQEDFHGGARQDRSTSDPLAAAFTFTTGETSSQAKETYEAFQDMDAEAAKSCALSAYHYRQGIILLFRELTQALHIPFDDPSKGRG